MVDVLVDVAADVVADVDRTGRALGRLIGKTVAMDPINTISFLQTSQSISADPNLWAKRISP
jgi:hypothetical protein